MDKFHVISHGRSVLAACTRASAPGGTPALGDVLGSHLALWSPDFVFARPIVNLPAEHLTLTVLDPDPGYEAIVHDPHAFGLQPDGGGPPQPIDRDSTRMLRIASFSTAQIVVETVTTPPAPIGDKVKVFVQDANGTLTGYEADPTATVTVTQFTVHVALSSAAPYGVVALLPGYLPRIEVKP